jgi:hypothetical protein
MFHHEGATQVDREVTNRALVALFDYLPQEPEEPEEGDAPPSEKQRQVSIGFTAFLRTGRAFIALWSYQMGLCRARTTQRQSA